MREQTDMTAEEQTGTTRSNSRTRRRRRTIIAVTALIAALIAGVMAFAVPALARGGSDHDGPSGDADVSEEDRDAAQQRRAEAREERLTETLAPLVDDGTLSESQRDAVVETLLEAHETAAGSHGHNRATTLHAATADDLGALLGLTTDELAQLLRDGDSLADIAADAEVESSAVVDLLVAGATERVDSAIEADRLAADDRDSCLAAVEEHLTARVNGEDADRSAVGNSCGVDRPGGEHERGAARGLAKRLRFWR